MHSLVADHDQVGVLLLGDVEDRVGGVAAAGVAVGLDTRRVRGAGGFLEHGVDLTVGPGPRRDLGIAYLARHAELP